MKRMSRRVALCVKLISVVADLAMVTSCAAQSTPVGPATPAASAAWSADIEPVDASLTQTFACADPIRWAAKVGDLNVQSNEDATGVMALTRPTSDTVEWGAARYRGFLFAKVGIAIKAQAKFSLVVPDAWKDRMRIGWGNQGYTLATIVQVPGCRSSTTDAAWLVYPGGFWLTQAACVPLTVRTDTESRTIRVPIGISCP